MINRDCGLSIEDFVSFYNEMMKNHRWGVYGVKFGAKYIDAITDTRDGQIWSITLRDIVADEEIWAKIPEPWKIKDGSLINIMVRDAMSDNYKSLKERTDYLLKLGM